MSTLTKIALDAREMEHPKPLEEAMKALLALNEENYFYMIHRKNPIPLIDMASEQHLQVLNFEDMSGNWHILITRSETINLSELLEEI